MAFVAVRLTDADYSTEHHVDQSLHAAKLIRSPAVQEAASYVALSIFRGCCNRATASGGRTCVGAGRAVGTGELECAPCR
jgi:hypothetical protein